MLRAAVGYMACHGRMSAAAADVHWRSSAILPAEG
jgi:hypothetical protein